MKRFMWAVLLGSFFLIPVTCTRQASYTVVAPRDTMILVARDKEVMENLIDCSITRDCPRLPAMKLLYEGKVFLVEGGTTVELSYNLFSSDAKKGQITSGKHSGEYCWIYDRMLYRDRSNIPYQLAFAQLSQSTIK